MTISQRQFNWWSRPKPPPFRTVIVTSTQKCNLLRLSNDISLLIEKPALLTKHYASDINVRMNDGALSSHDLRRAIFTQKGFAFVSIHPRISLSLSRRFFLLLSHHRANENVKLFHICNAGKARCIIIVAKFNLKSSFAVSSTDKGIPQNKLLLLRSFLIQSTNSPHRL